MHKLLPERRSADESFEHTEDYTVELLTPADCRHIGETVEEAKLNTVEGGQLIEIIRFDREVISPVPADEYLMGGDRLVFAGRVEEILNLRKSHGLVNADHPVFTVDELDKKRLLRTAYIMQGCELAGKRLSETTLEHDYQFTLVAVARQGERIRKSPRDIELRAGDSLLIESTRGAKNTVIIRGLQFFESSSLIPNIGSKTLVSSLIMLAMIVLSSLEIMPLLQSAMLAAFAMLVFRCCTPTQAMKAIDWNILMIFAGSVVIGTAIQKTGIAEAMANGMMSACGDTPPLGDDHDVCCQHIPHRIYLQHCRWCHLLPDCLSSSGVNGCQSSPLHHLVDDCGIEQFCHSYRLTYSYACLWSWWLPFL